MSQGFGFAGSNWQASKSWDRWKDSQTRGPTYATIGLEKAGINRILAAGGGIGASSAKSVLAATPSPGGGGGADLALGERKAMMNAQKFNAERQGYLATSKDAALAGEVQEAHQLSEFLQTPQGKFWVQQKFINGAVPNGLDAAAAKMLMQILPGAAGSLKDKWNED